MEPVKGAGWLAGPRGGILDGMKITRLLAYQVDLPLREGSYNWSGGKSMSVFDSTVVRIETDAELAGHGEVCPLGPAPSNVATGIPLVWPSRSQQAMSIADFT